MILLRAKLALISLFNPWAANKQLRAENDRLMQTISDPLLTGINIGNGSIDIGLEGAAPMLLAGMFLGMFEKYPDAKNYIEVTLSSPKGPVMVTVVRPGGKSPHALRREAEVALAASIRGAAAQGPERDASNPNE